MRRGTERLLHAALLLAATLLVEHAGAQHEATTDAVATVVTGNVVDENGDAIEGAAVGFLEATRPTDVAAVLAAPAGTSDERGDFSVTRPASLQRSFVVVTAAGRQTCCMLSNRLTAHLHLGQIVLPAGGQLIGRVRDEQGRAIAGAAILVESAIGNYSQIGQAARSGAVTDARGIFRAHGVPRTGLRLTATAAGYRTETRFVSHESPLSLTMRPAPIVRGRIVDEHGRPVAGTQVRVHAEAAGHDNYLGNSAITDADGHFELTGPPPPIRYRLGAYDPVAIGHSYRSPVLLGAQDDVAFESVAAQAEVARRVVVHAVDAETGRRIERFSLARTTARQLDPQSMLFAADGSFAEHHTEAVLLPPLPNDLYAIVYAPGRAFTIEPLPLDADAPIVVRLGPEAVLTGRVVDEHGEPAAGVGVRALPDGSANGWSSKPLSERWPRTDAQGRYRIGNLRPGTYQVQAYPVDRPPSAPQQVEVSLDAENTLDVTVDARRDVTVVVEGSLPDGPPPTLMLVEWSRERRGGYRQEIERPAPFVLRAKQREHPFGSQQGPRLTLAMYVPSRVRVGEGVKVPLEAVDVVDGKAVVRLPRFERHLVRGRVEGDLPTARIAVVATPIDAQPGRPARDRKAFAGLQRDGTFTLELPPGAHALQLADVATGIVFHTETDDFQATPRGDDDPIVLRPELHWLELRLSCAVSGRPAMLSGIRVELARPRDGALDAFLRHSSTSHTESHAVPAPDDPVGRWLVPAGEVKLTARQGWQRLIEGSFGYGDTDAYHLTLLVHEREHTVELKVPPPPSEAALERRGG